MRIHRFGCKEVQQGRHNRAVAARCRSGQRRLEKLDEADQPPPPFTSV